MTDICRSIDFGWIAEQYISARGGQQRIYQTVNLLKPYLNTSDTILDIGTGPAQIASILARNSRVICLDISAEMTKVAAKMSLSIIQADAQELPLVNECVDAALMLWVLNHVGNPSKAMQEAYRVLRMKGRLLYLSGIPKHPSWDTLGNVLNRLDSLRQARLKFEGHLAPFAESIGMEILEEGSYIVRFRQRPRGLAKRIEDRSYGHLRNLDEETWQRTVVPTIETLNRLPDSNSYYTRENNYKFIVFEKQS